jgi:hypothetical protein
MVFHLAPELAEVVGQLPEPCMDFLFCGTFFHCACR